MKHRAFSASITIIAVLLAGCATITTSTTQTISITSNVDGATLFLDAAEIGTTPFNGVVAKNKKELKIVKEGYRTETVVLSKTLEGMFWGNIIIGGTIGSITDFASGAAYAYAPATYQIDLKADDQAAMEYEHQLVVRKFSMIYIDEISHDLTVGQGEYIAALIELLGTQADPSTEIESIRSALERSGGDQIRFGEAVVALM